MKFLTPLILIALAFGLSYWYVYPSYSEIITLRTDLSNINAAIVRAQKAIERKNDLVDQYNSFSTEDRTRLETMLPNSINNIRLLVDLNTVADKYSDGIRDIKITSNDSSSSGVAVATSQSKYGTLNLSFTTKMSYVDFQKFLQDVEKSLRLMDVTTVSFKPTETGTTYDYSVTLKTYWLR